MNCGATFRLGVLGNWSVTSSTIRKMVSTVTVIGWAIHSDHLSVTSIQPSIAPQATAAGGVIARRPATTPISKANRSTETSVIGPPTGGWTSGR